MTATASDPLGRLVEHFEAHSPLSPSERASIRSIPNTRSLVRRERQAMPATPGSSVGLVVSGLLGSVGFTKDGKRQIIGVFIPGEVCNVGAIVADQASVEILGLVASEVRWLDGQHLLKLARQSGNVAEALWRESVLHSAILKEWIINLGRRRARERIAHLLCEMACRYAPESRKDGLTFSFPVTQEQLADIVGLTTMHVNRTVQALRAAGIADMRRRSVKILAWSRLVEEGDFNPYYLPPVEGI